MGILLNSSYYVFPHKCCLVVTAAPVVRLYPDDVFDVCVTCVDADANATNENWRRVNVRVHKIDDGDDKDDDNNLGDSIGKEVGEEVVVKIKQGEKELADERSEIGKSPFGKNAFQVCVLDREGERERERKKERKKEREN